MLHPLAPFAQLKFSETNIALKQSFSAQVPFDALKSFIYLSVLNKLMVRLCCPSKLLSTLTFINHTRTSRVLLRSAASLCRTAGMEQLKNVISASEQYLQCYTSTVLYLHWTICCDPPWGHYLYLGKHRPSRLKNMVIVYQGVDFILCPRIKTNKNHHCPKSPQEVYFVACAQQHAQSKPQLVNIEQELSGCKKAQKTSLS